MNTVDLAKTIAPKSDQLNADDLIAGPMTITVTSVRGCDEADQPIAIHFDGDGGKPYKPCKSMRRVLVHCWGADGKAYAGRRMALYRDENVMFGGIKVGGIRISHMSHIDREKVMALTTTRAKRAPYSVKPLRAEVRDGPKAQRPEPAARAAPPVEQRATADDRGFDPETIPGVTRGFGGGKAAAEEASPPDQDESAALRWGRELQEDLEGDAFKSTAELDGCLGDPDNQAMFVALAEENPDYAERLNALIVRTGNRLSGARG